VSPVPGELYLVDFGMVGKVRPAVIISREDPNAPRALVVCAPLTTENRGSDYEVPLGKLKFLDRESVGECPRTDESRPREIDPSVGPADGSADGADKIGAAFRARSLMSLTGIFHTRA